MENIQVCILVSAILIFIVIYVCIFSRVFHESFSNCKAENHDDEFALASEENCSHFNGEREDCKNATRYQLELVEPPDGDAPAVSILKKRNCNWDSDSDKCTTSSSECTVKTSDEDEDDGVSTAKMSEFENLVDIIQEDIPAFREYKKDKFQSHCQKWMTYDMGKKKLEDYYYSKLDKEDRDEFNHACKDWWEDNE